MQVCYLLSDEEQNEQHTSLIETALKWTGADHTILSAIDISEGEEIKPMNWQQAILDEYQEIMIADNLKIVPTWGETDDFPANANGSKTSGTSAANSAPMDPPTIIRLNPVWIDNPVMLTRVINPHGASRPEREEIQIPSDWMDQILAHKAKLDELRSQ